ncbi:MAG: hypothetical protein ACK40M_03430 [Flavobacteriales bacterium]
MDKFKEIISTFSDKDMREFRYFLVRHRPKSERKDLELLQELAEGEVVNDRKGKDDYHSLRKRLMRQLSEFVVLKQLQDDVTETSSVLGWVSMARYLFEKRMNATAWKYLLRAEKSAIASERYDLLNSVYLLMLENAHTSSHYSIEALINQMEDCKIRADEDERLLKATAMIRRRMEEAKLSGNIYGLSDFVEATLDRFQLGSAIMNRPIHLFRIMEIIRSTYLAVRDLSNFESLVLEQYTVFSKAAGDSPHYQHFRLNFIYMIAHVLYHNRKYIDSDQWLEKLEAEMKKNSGRHERQFAARLVSMRSSIYSFTGRNDEAIAILEGVLEDGTRKFDFEDILNLKLNLVFCFFLKGEFRKANRVFVHFGQHSDSFLQKKMGQEWLLRSRMIQLIVQYELGNEDISLTLIRSLERDHAAFLDQPQYKKAKNYLQFLKNYMKDPFAISFSDFHQKALQELFVLPAGTEESKAIAFYCWLKAKLIGRDYYSVLLEEVAAKPDEN